MLYFCKGITNKEILHLLVMCVVTLCDTFQLASSESSKFLHERLAKISRRLFDDPADQNKYNFIKKTFSFDSNFSSLCRQMVALLIQPFKIKFVF